MKDIEILENMRDNIYGAMQFEDDYQISELEEKEFNALNSAITALKQNQRYNDRIKELEKKNNTEKLRHYKDGFYAGYDNVKKQIKNAKDYLEIKYKEALETNSVNGFKLKCQIDVLQELLGEDYD